MTKREYSCKINLEQKCAYREEIINIVCEVYLCLHKMKGIACGNARYRTYEKRKDRMSEKKIRVAVIDGQGGGMGRAITQRIRAAFPNVMIRVLGTNAAATATMLKGGADDGATGENAVVYNASRVQAILGPVGILMANGLLGEVTPAMAAAIGDSDAVKILLPSRQCSIRIASGPSQPMQGYLNDAMRLLAEELENL